MITRKTQVTFNFPINYSLNAHIFCHEVDIPNKHIKKSSIYY